MALHLEERHEGKALRQDHHDGMALRQDHVDEQGTMLP